MADKENIEVKEEEVVVATEETPQADAAPAAETAKRSKGGKSIPAGIAVINATFNNTKVTFTDLHGNALCWSSGGKIGMKGSRKSTAYAAQMVAAEAAKKAEEALGDKAK